MSVAREEVERIARLARLRLEPGELGRITADLNHILEHVEALRSLDGGEREREPAAGERVAWEPGAAEDGAARGVGRRLDEGWGFARGDSSRGFLPERPDAEGLDLRRMAPDFRDGFFVVPPLPGTRHEAAP